MLVYGALLPHSATLHSLVAGQPHGLPPSIDKAFADIAADLHGRGVKTIVSIGTHPHYRRGGFSAYVAPEYQLSFKDLGDLVHEESLLVDWDLFHALREASVGGDPILHPIDDAHLDLAHALPLWLIHRHFPVEEKRRYLCINDSPTALPQERAAMAETLAAVLSASAHPIALVVSQEMLIADTPQPAILEVMKAANTAARYQCSGLWSKNDAAMDTIIACLSGPLALAHAAFRQPRPWMYEERCFEHSGLTSLLAARLLPPREP